MSKIFITGAAGFIGSNFTRMILNRKSDWQILAYDSLTYAGNLANLSDLKNKENFTFIKGDITNTQTVEKYMPDTDYLINFAAESHVDRSIHGCADFIRTNIDGTRILLDAANKFKVKKFIQISTDEVYGALGAEGFFTETTPLHPNSPYSASKASADLLALAYNHTHDTPVIITRCSNNYGPYQFPEKLIPLFVTNLIDNKAVPVYGDGKQVRDWIHVLDHCNAILAVLEKGKLGEIYNIGSDNEQYNIDITKTILEILDKNDTYIEHVTDRPGHDRRYAIDSSKIKTELEWYPQIDFEAGLKDTIQWYIENKQWWQEIKTGQYLKYYQKQYGKKL